MGECIVGKRKMVPDPHESLTRRARLEVWTMTAMLRPGSASIRPARAHLLRIAKKIVYGKIEGQNQLLNKYGLMRHDLVKAKVALKVARARQDRGTLPSLWKKISMEKLWRLKQ